MPNAARLSGVGTFYAFEFDDNTNTSFSVSADSTVYASNIDETASITTSESLSSISVPTIASFNDGRSSHTLTGLLLGDIIIYAVAYQGGFSDISLPTDSQFQRSTQVQAVIHLDGTTFIQRNFRILYYYRNTNN